MGTGYKDFYSIVIVGFIAMMIGILLIISVMNKQEEPIQEPTQTKVIEKVIRIEGIQTHSYNCTITAYSPCVTETDDTPYQTALMEKPIAGGTCAVSHDLKQYLGNRIYIYQIGVFRVNDLMNRRYKKRIDLFMGKREAKEFGRKDNQFVVFF